MKNLLIAFFCTMWGVCWGQQSDAEKYLRELSASYVEDSTKLANATRKLEEIKTKIVPTNSDANIVNEITEEMQKTRKIQISLDSIYTIAQNSISHYATKEKLQVGDLRKYFPHVHQVSTSEPASKSEIKTISYFGEGQTIDHDILKGKTGKEVGIIKTALATDDKEHYLGDITIPKKGQKFYFYRSYRKKDIKYLKDADTYADEADRLLKRNHVVASSKEILSVKDKEHISNDYILTEKVFKFNKINVEVKDGYFYDIVAHVDDEFGNTHIFTNQVGLSVLFFSSYGVRKFMYYSHSEKKNSRGGFSDAELSNLYIKLTDIFSYSYDIGNHYIPLELKIRLPDDIKDNEKGNVKYRILQKAPLEKIVELRVYSDFLALFGDAANGLVQVDGKATFYMFPYPFRVFGSERVLGQIEYFPTLSPYANYSRFENKSRFVTTYTDQVLNVTIPESLSLIEKRFLSMGVEGEILKWQHKNAPVKLSLYGFVNYNISDINIGSEENADVIGVKSMGHGFGLHLGTKRFNNFGFDYKAELSWFNYKNFNSVKGINTGFVVPVFKHQAEVFYNPNGNPSSAIFVRLVTHNYTGPKIDEAFYQFQFGYKFAIGNRAVSK